MPSSPAALPPWFWPPGEGDGPREPPPAGVEVLGHDGETFLIVRGDTVVSADREAERFVNSSRDRFIASLELLRSAWAVRADLSEEQAVRQARELREDIAARDEAAVSSQDHWWSLVLDELEFGVL